MTDWLQPNPFAEREPNPRLVSDKKVVQAFIDRDWHRMASKKLSYEVFPDPPFPSRTRARIDGNWMGGMYIAEWRNGRIHFSVTDSKSKEKYQRMIRRMAPKALLAGGTGFD